MKEGEASRTAEYNALFRAMETYRRPKKKRLFVDLLAPCFLGVKARRFLLIYRIPIIGHLIPRYIDKKWPGVRSSALGRTCWIDDQVLDALQYGIEQIVILGAGYDCRAYRLPNIENSKVFELDHPDTLKIKRACLLTKLATLPKHVTYIEIDFDTQNLTSALRSNGFDPTRATFILWEGVMHYLNAEVVDQTLRVISSIAPLGSRLVFTYIHRGLLDNTVQFGKLGDVPSTLQESDEKWIFGLYPEHLSEYLSDRGFKLIDDISSLEYRAKYMGASGSHMKGFEFYRVALAKVAGN